MPFLPPNSVKALKATFAIVSLGNNNGAVLTIWQSFAKFICSNLAISITVHSKDHRSQILKNMTTRRYRNTHIHTTVYSLFPRLPRWAGARRNLLLDFMVQGKITEADTPTIQMGDIASGLISDPPPSSPYFYARCPSCHNPPNLSWLVTGTKYAGLHTQLQLQRSQIYVRPMLTYSWLNLPHGTKQKRLM